MLFSALLCANALGGPHFNTYVQCLLFKYFLFKLYNDYEFCILLKMNFVNIYLISGVILSIFSLPKVIRT